MSRESRPTPVARGTRSTPGARDAALGLVRRINRWTIAGAVAASGALSLFAASAFHGRTLRPASPASPASAAPSGGGAAAAGAPAPSAPASEPAVQAPVEPPVAAPTDTGPVVSSGGS